LRTDDETLYWQLDFDSQLTIVSLLFSSDGMVYMYNLIQ